MHISIHRISVPNRSQNTKRVMIRQVLPVFVDTFFNVHVGPLLSKLICSLLNNPRPTISLSNPGVTVMIGKLLMLHQWPDMLTFLDSCHYSIFSIFSPSVFVFFKTLLCNSFLFTMTQSTMHTTWLKALHHDNDINDLKLLPQVKNYNYFSLWNIMTITIFLGRFLDIRFWSVAEKIQWHLALVRSDLSSVSVHP